MKIQSKLFLLLALINTAYAMPAGTYHCPTIEEVNKAIYNPGQCMNSICTWGIDSIEKEGILFSLNYYNPVTSWTSGNLLAVDFFKADKDPIRSDPRTNAINCRYRVNSPYQEEAKKYWGIDYAITIRTDKSLNFDNCTIKGSTIECQ